jgi:AcrR family transcriptional regulator
MSVQTRGRLLEAAKKVFSEKGFHNTQISHIIDEAGVARGTFYLHFKSKEEIFEELLQEVVEELKDRIKVIELHSDPVEQVVENFERVIEFALQEKELAKIVLQRNCDPQLSRITDEFFEGVIEFISASIRKGIDMGLLRECNPDLLARAVVGAIKETILGLLDREEVDTYAVARELVELGARGVWKNEGGDSYGDGSAI